jgi:thymidylate synthase ThyX
MPNGVSAKILLDSINRWDNRLTSFEITAHRFILAEINTHCLLARNYRSSRAVPTRRLIQEVRENPAYPVEWRRNAKGMVAGDVFEPWEIEREKMHWRMAAWDAARHAEEGHERGLAKQWVNRHLEPYLYVHGVVSATELENFFSLRTAPDAQPEFRVLADCVLEALRASTPVLFEPGQWHLPYIDNEDVERAVEHVEVVGGNLMKDPLVILKKMSTSRIARVTNKTFDSDHKPTMEADIRLHDDLALKGHWSPFEHIATPYEEGIIKFQGWQQYRHTFPNENQRFAI